VGAVRRASELADPTVASGVDRLLPVAPELRTLLPTGGLRRGSTVAVTAGTSSLVLALLAGASASGAWSAVVGMPGLGAVAAAQAGVALERLALIPYPGPEWAAVVAVLLDGVDLVVAAPPAPVATRLAGRLAARARQRGSVLVAYGGPWEGADLTLTAERGVWEGLSAGRGRLRHRELTIIARGRGAASRQRWVRVRLPDSTGRLAAAPADERPVFTVIDGEAA
jgi:NADPH:quinone reductase-like Zn-dependent oxidoreductase